jgi:hypothetical protein
VFGQLLLPENSGDGSMKLASFRRKLIYIIAIVVLLVPVFILGQPSVPGKSDGTGSSQGGTLAQIRERYNIGQADLGKIDPASESMKLATLGLRGVASTILWQKAEYYKKESLWERYAATLNQISLLQPHFINVWEHQAHNLSYNISVEFDDYHQRYEWIKKGIDYLIDGTKFNKRQPILQWDLGIYTGQKIGTADEQTYYREMFRNDTEYHNHLISEGLDVRTPDALGVDQKPDHWLVGRLWFNKSYDLVDGGAYCRKSPHIYYSDGPKCQLRFCEAIEKEGVLDERAKYQWIKAGEWWREFGNRDVLTTWGHTVKMNGHDAAKEVYKQALDAFNEFVGDAREKLLASIREGLTQEERDIVDSPSDKLSLDQRRRLGDILGRMQPSTLAIAGSVPLEKRPKAIELGTKVNDAAEFLSHLESYRSQVNYDYWLVRPIAEQNDITLRARQKMYDADIKLTKADVDGALADYDAAWVDWYKVFARWPRMMTDDAGLDVMNSLQRYKRVLDKDYPEDFILADFVDFYEKYKKGGFDFEVDAFLEKWNKQAELIGKDEINFFKANMPKEMVDQIDNNLPEPKAPENQSTPDSQPPAAEPTPAGSENPESGSPPTQQSEAASPAPASRPPKLENPALPDQKPGDGN